jgi:hypothetical protein
MLTPSNGSDKPGPIARKPRKAHHPRLKTYDPFQIDAARADAVHPPPAKMAGNPTLSSRAKSRDLALRCGWNAAPKTSSGGAKSISPGRKSGVERNHVDAPKGRNGTAAHPFSISLAAPNRGCPILRVLCEGWEAHGQLRCADDANPPGAETFNSAPPCRASFRKPQKIVEETRSGASRIYRERKNVKALHRAHPCAKNAQGWGTLPGWSSATGEFQGCATRQ